MGDATIASAAQGRRINEHIIKELSELVKKNMG